MPEPDPTAVTSSAAAGSAERRARAAEAFRDLGGAEGRARAAEAEVAPGDEDLEAWAFETLGAAGCQEQLDALRLLSWRARGLHRALEVIDVGGPRGAEDAMMLSVVVVAEALADLATALSVIRDPDAEDIARDDAAVRWRRAIVEIGRLSGNEPVELRAGPSPAS